MKKFVILVFSLLFIPLLALAQGPGGYCLDYEGNDWVKIADNDTLDNTNTLTIEFWVYPDTLDGEVRGVISKRTSWDDNNSYGVFFWESDHLFIDLDGDNDRIELSKTFTVNKWYYVAIVYDGALSEANRVKVYVADAADDTVTLSTTSSESSTAIPNNTSDLYIGKLNISDEPDYGCFAGSIDEVRIWNVAREEANINENFKKEISGSSSGLVAYWRFNENTGQTAYDSTSNDNNGQLGSTSGVDANDPSWVDSYAPLPVTLSSFTAYYSENGPILHWITQSEDDNIGWNIYRNDENELNNAVKVNTDLIDGQGTTAEPSYYNYSDNSEELTIGTTYYYWLESLDLSGQTHVYDNSLVTITIPDPTNQPPNYEKPVVYSLNAAPNPMLDQTDFHFTLDRDAMVNISIYNLKGKLIKKLPAIAANSDEKMIVYWNGKDSNNKRLNSGIYLYKLGVNGKTIKTNKLLIIR